MNDPLEPGMDPRKHLRRHKERGPVRYTYTVHDVAQAFGVHVDTLLRWRKKNLIKVNDIKSIVRFARSSHQQPSKDTEG